jgi:hypothetical protein
VVKDTCECGRKFDKSQSLNSHYRHCLVHRGGKPPITLKGVPSPLRGKTLDEIVRDPEKTRMLMSLSSTGRICADETRKLLSAKRVQSLADGKGFSFGNKGYFDGFWFDSSWELAFYLWHRDVNEVKPRKNTGIRLKFEDDKGKIRTMIPDFEMPDGKLVEIKGFPSQFTAAKVRCLSNSVQFLFYADVKLMLKYCRDKYGKEFWKSFYA